MHLYVIRHAIAEEAAPGQDDAARDLTPEGEKKARRVVRGLRELDIELERILTSPWRRAARTAALLAPLCDAPPIETELLCQSPRAELLALIAERGESTAVVGHEPWLAELVAWLAFGDVRHGDALDLRKAGVVWLEGGALPGGMALRAFLPPRFARAIADK
jgi:phosphohistidine phosphatase